MHTIAISHGEGRFVASDDVLAQLKANGQIATQYVDEAGVPGMDLDVNPNGSLLAIEGITSPDGRVFGKMGHSERYSNGTFVNVPGEKDQPLFAAAWSTSPPEHQDSFHAHIIKVGSKSHDSEPPFHIQQSATFVIAAASGGKVTLGEIDGPVGAFHRIIAGLRGLSDDVVVTGQGRRKA